MAAEADPSVGYQPGPDLVEYEPRFHHSMLDLFARHFGAWSARGYERRFAWESVENPFSVQRSWRTVLLVDSNRVVGHLAGTPIPLRVQGETQIALSWGSFCVDDEYRGRALPMMRSVTRDVPLVAGGMSKRVQEIFDRLAGPKLPVTETLWTLQRRNVGASVRRASARIPGKLSPCVPSQLLRLAAPLLLGERSAPSLPPPSLPAGMSMRPILRFEERYDALWLTARERFEACVDKSSRYMNWRYFDCPTLTPHVLGLFDAQQQLAGIVVGVERGVRDYRGRVCGIEVTLAELITVRPDAKLASALIGALLYELDAHGVDSFDAFACDGPSKVALRSRGFVPRDDHTFALGVGLGRARRDQVRQLRWYATAGDGDALFAPAL